MTKDVTEIPVVFEEVSSNQKTNKNMANETQAKPITEMTSEEIKEFLAKKTKAEEKKRKRERQAYISERDANINELIEEALELNERMLNFKQKVAAKMQHQHEKLDGYGSIRANSKGGFSITHSDNTMKIVRRRDTEPKWDERSEKAVLLIKEFLNDVVKKRFAKMYNILMGFLVRNKNGDLEYSRVMEMLAHEKEFDDERWVEGLRLLKESFSNVLKAYGFELKHKATDGDKWDNINLNFSSL